MASQSGNFVSSFMNWAGATGVGISRAVSAGNAAAVTVADYLRFYADDPATAVGLAYVEGIADGRRFFDDIAAVTAGMPLVLVKGGATAGGAAGRRVAHRCPRQRRPHLRRCLPPEPA